jgi:bifunctional non-homologous end joining protein LigD
MVEREEVRVEVDGRVLTLTSLSKVLYPRTGMTKGEVLNYYAQVAPVLLPQLEDRAVTRIRWPHGIGDMSFFEKNAPAGTPKWVRTVTVPTTGSRTAEQKEGTLTFPILDSLAALTWAANLSALELHVHQWRGGAARTPAGANRIVIDLDPGEPAGLQECCQVALLVREALGERGLAAAPVLSGSKGLHLYAALPEPVEPDVSTALAKEIAEQLQKQHPSKVTATMTKSRRSGKVFLDWSQNSGSKTTICPYSLRGKEIPKVAAPVTWDEVADGAEDPLAIDQLGPNDVVTRVSESGDLFTRATGP